jgi:hypothetical protein
MKIQVKCPKCSTVGYINVEKRKLDDIQTGIIAVEISKNLICEHFFVVYIDRNGDIRNYCVADFELPKQKAVDIGRKTDENFEEMDIYLIKMNIYPSILTYIVKSIVLHKKILIISENTVLDSHIRHFFQYITQDSFELDLSVMNLENYQNNNKSIDYDIIFKGNKIIKQSSTELILKNLTIEEKIVQRFLEESDVKTGLLILKNEIKKLYEISKYIIQIIKESKTKEKKKINPQKIIKTIEKKYNALISTEYLEFIYAIIENYFSLHIPKEFKTIFQLYLGITSF